MVTPFKIRRRRRNEVKERKGRAGSKGPYMLTVSPREHPPSEVPFLRSPWLQPARGDGKTSLWPGESSGNSC